MKTELIFIPKLKDTVTFYIGKNAKDNFDVIDMGSDDDIWFHANNESSSHVVAIIPDDIDKKELKSIVKIGGQLCKQNTSKLMSLKNVEIIYTQVKYVTKTSVPGCVLTTNTKTIKC
jgi:predicted ribosome quality control (RQC) complex YloA/Tae2 family protein